MQALLYFFIKKEKSYLSIELTVLYVPSKPNTKLLCSFHAKILPELLRNGIFAPNIKSFQRFVHFSTKLSFP